MITCALPGEEHDACHRDAARFEVVDLLEEHLRVDHAPGADQRRLALEHARSGSAGS
jgi:hypothetical protein